MLNIFVLHREKAVEYCQKLNFEYRVEAVRESKVNKKIAKRYEDNFRSHPLARISQLPVPFCRSSSPLSGRPPAAPFPCADFLFLLLRTHGVRGSFHALSVLNSCVSHRWDGDEETEDTTFGHWATKRSGCK